MARRSDSWRCEVGLRVRVLVRCEAVPRAGDRERDRDCDWRRVWWEVWTTISELHTAHSVTLRLRVALVEVITLVRKVLRERDTAIVNCGPVVSKRDV